MLSILHVVLSINKVAAKVFTHATVPVEMMIIDQLVKVYYELQLDHDLPVRWKMKGRF